MLEKMKAIGAMPMLNRLSRESHLAFHKDFNVCAETFLPEERMVAIQFTEAYSPALENLIAANSKLSAKNEIVERDVYIAEAYTLFKQIRKIVAGHADDGKGTISDAKILFKILKSYDFLVNRRAVTLRITQIPKLISRLSEYEHCFERFGIKTHIENLSRAINNADVMQKRIIVINAKNTKLSIKETRYKADAAYRSMMLSLNAILLVNKNTSDIDIFRDKWAEMLLLYKSAFSSKEGARIKRAGESEQSESPKKKVKYYKHPNPRLLTKPEKRTKNTSGGGNDLPPVVIPPNMDDIPLYDPNKHYTEYKLGDLVRLENGDIYRVKSLGHVHYHPDSKYGYWGWETVWLAG